MIHLLTNRCLQVFVFIFALSLWGCALTGRQTPSYNPEITEIMASVKAQNQTVNTVNGIGGITLTDRDQVSRYRLAWAAAFPDRLRLIILFSGKPVESFAYDGRCLTIKSHTQAHDLIKKKKKNPNLEKLTTLPLYTEQIIEFLTGRIPILPHRSAQIEKNTQGGYILTLFQKRNMVVEILYLDADKHVMSYDIPDEHQARYRVSLSDYDPDTNEGFSFPRQITIDQNARSLVMRIDQTQPNPDLPANVFKLVPE